MKSSTINQRDREGTDRQLKFSFSKEGLLLFWDLLLVESFDTDSSLRISREYYIVEVILQWIFKREMKKIAQSLPRIQLFAFHYCFRSFFLNFINSGKWSISLRMHCVATIKNLYVAHSSTSHNSEHVLIGSMALKQLSVQTYWK